MNGPEELLRTIASPELDHEAPPARPYGDYLVSGRAALRRRRLRSFAATAVIVLMMSALGLVTHGLAPWRADNLSPSAAEDISSEVPIVDNLKTEDDGLDINRDGQLVRHSQATVRQLIEDPVPTDADVSVAISIAFHGEERWVYLYWSAGGRSGGGSDPAGPADDFVEWAQNIDLSHLEVQEQLAQPVE